LCCSLSLVIPQDLRFFFCASCFPCCIFVLGQHHPSLKRLCPVFVCHRFPLGFCFPRHRILASVRFLLPSRSFLLGLSNRHVCTRSQLPVSVLVRCLTPSPSQCQERHARAPKLCSVFYPVPRAGLRFQELPPRSCAAPEFAQSPVVCGAFLVEFTHQRVINVFVIFALGSFDFCLDCCR
jgi:hypothetical protein